MEPFTKHIKMHELRVQALSRGLGARLNVNQGASDSCSHLPFFIDTFSRGYSQKSTDLCKHMQLFDTLTSPSTEYGTFVIAKAFEPPVLVNK